MVLPKKAVKNNRESAFFSHPDLPVTQVLPKLSAALAHPGRAVLQAPPGSGKTTRVPLALVDAPWLAGRKILMLEPRRLAARACARFMAGLCGESVGETVGYRIRMETQVGPHTRIEVVTEAILTRMIQNDPALEKVGLVIFDEFHERHIHSDLGLALCLESAEVLRPDLRILVMSATMDTDALGALLDPVEIVTSKGRQWPVETIYQPPIPCRSGPGPFGSVLAGCVSAVLTAISDHKGDILVFLPGAAEIRRMEQMLAKKTGPNVQVFALSGRLSFDRQRAALAPSPRDHRKVVLATAIAETSLTIEGVTIVVDAGLMRKPMFFPGTGLTRLQTLPVSRASADQRRGRAGRTGPGICFRIWSEHVHKGLVPFSRPEILEQDLTGVVLELALWGVRDPDTLKWLDPPPARAFSRARDLLHHLGCLDDAGNITLHGKTIAGAGIHPRLAHMILKADRSGNGFLGCCLAVLLEENQDLPGFSRDPDIRSRLEILAVFQQNWNISRGQSPQNPDMWAHSMQRELKKVQAPAKNWLAASRRLARKLAIRDTAIDPEKAGITLSLGFPERVAARRGPLSYIMASGSGAVFHASNTVSMHEYILAAHVGGHPENARIYLAAPVWLQDLEQVWAHEIKIRESVMWDSDKQGVQAISRTFFGQILIRQTPLPDPDPEAVLNAMMEGIRQMGPAALPWTRKQMQFRHRVCFLREQAGLSRFPDLSDAGLMETLSLWLGPFLTGVRSARDLKQVDLAGALTALFSWDDQHQVDMLAPSHITVPSGSRIPLSYSDGSQVLASPILAVRLQEMFGEIRTPTVASGRIAVTLHLLSPAGRPVQVTKDLENFWKNTYKEVKKDLMGRYPKHFWPDDPLTAVPTRRAKPRK
ncbi:ATP-dependent RNA helicase HrpB [Desulfotignum phosphitoxidans DSM 13687]|uniref:ATP-dependent RNA helicase HrpB n=1 Tax=Desulfotignum phosphitoxidans DSM 13687 TaxID=1286635 RepID=S0FYX7_9BACT|nr:ATP-dependent RNA helicase HrpB [Desulfotignum phosphitoxidans DSM 13687]